MFHLFAVPSQVLVDESTLMVSAPEHPLDWESSWHFVRRAAPLARAPSLLG
jgi:hypothetical protein